MKKVANFTKDKVKNGALVAGGHRIKFVSDDKEFIILATRFGTYQGFYLTYEKDGAYVDQERTPAPSKETSFDSLEDCMKFYKIGDYAEQKAEVIKINKWEKQEVKEVVTPNIVKMDKSDNNVEMLSLSDTTTTQDGMRKIISDICQSMGKPVERVSIWQHNGNGDYGIAVGFNGKTPVAVAPWERTRTEKSVIYQFLQTFSPKYDNLRKRVK